MGLVVIGVWRRVYRRFPHSISIALYKSEFLCNRKQAFVLKKLNSSIGTRLWTCTLRKKVLNLQIQLKKGNWQYTRNSVSSGEVSFNYHLVKARKRRKLRWFMPDTSMHSRTTNAVLATVDS